MDMNLGGKIAVVAGSTAGIGFACAVELAHMGAEVVITGRQDDAVNEAVGRIKGRVGSARLRGVAADLGTAEGVAALIEQVPDADVLVNNVAIYERRDFFAITDAEWQRLFDINVMSGVRASRHYLQGMLERDWGRIVFIASDTALQSPAGMIHYGMTKAANMNIARGIAELTRGTHVTCNSVLPGPTDTRGFQQMMDAMARQQNQSSEQLRQDFMRHHPSSLIQRLVTPEEVAGMVAYVCSPAASATNGAPLRVEGGILPTMA